MEPVNHFAIFRNVQIEPVTYPYYDPKTIGLAYDAFLDTLRSAPSKSVFLLHACAHNPTGVDPTKEQWGKIADVILALEHAAVSRKHGVEIERQHTLESCGPFLDKRISRVREAACDHVAGGDQALARQEYDDVAVGVCSAEKLDLNFATAPIQRHVA